MSFPDRGKWGKAGWRGNCSGHVYREIFEQLTPRTFCDPMVGSGTSVEVAGEMGIQAWGLDLHSGFNILRQSILETIGQEVDCCLAHPPYHSVVIYSGVVWGEAPHRDDLSRCEDEEDFIEKLQLAVLNQREAVVPGGVYGVIIGDQRKAGKYRSYQADIIARLPPDELKAVLVKVQHNTVSGNRDYAKMRYPRIEHEYIVLWERPKIPMVLFGTLKTLAERFHREIHSTWANIVQFGLMECGGEADLSNLYDKVTGRARDAFPRNHNMEAKIRQTLQLHPRRFVRIETGRWRLAEAA